MNNSNNKNSDSSSITITSNILHCQKQYQLAATAKITVVLGTENWQQQWQKQQQKQQQQ